MQCPLCEGATRRFGKNRNGSQRFRCDACKKTFTDAATRPVDRRRLDASKMILALRMILEGNSVRSVERLMGIHRDTIIDAMVAAGRVCKTFLEKTCRHLPVVDIQADEIWGFVCCKEKTKRNRGYGEECGDAYCFTAIERGTKMIVAWHLGKRSPEDTLEFAEKLRRATVPDFQLTTDGFRPYLNAIPTVFGHRLHFATLTKVYGATDEESQRRYSPPRIIEVIETVQTGNPVKERICTSHIERSNLTIRMTIRRMTRLTNAHSKKWENHEAAMALFFAYYNFCRVHQTIRCTPAVKAGLAVETWSLEQLLENANAL